MSKLERENKRDLEEQLQLLIESTVLMVDLIFSKTLHQTHIRNALPVPSRALYFGFRNAKNEKLMEFEAFDVDGVAWRFSLSMRKSGPYPKPVLVQSCWLPFLKEKGLRENDQVSFFMEQDEESKATRYLVRVKRRTMTLFGHDIWVDLEKLQSSGSHSKD